MDKNLIVTIDIPYPTASHIPRYLRGRCMGDHTAEFLHDYAVKYGADVKTVRQYDCQGIYPDTPEWAIVPALKEFAASDYDQMLYVDSDVIISPITLSQNGGNVFDRPPGFWAERDLGYPNKDTAMAVWAGEKMGAVLKDFSDNWETANRKAHYFNSGVIVVDRATAKLIVETMDKFPYINGPVFRDQEYLNAILDQSPVDVQWMSDTGLYNWPAIELTADSLGKFFLHFVGGGHKAKLPKFAEFFRAQKKLWK